MKQFLSLIISFTLFACASNSPAPIEFKDARGKSSKSDESSSAITKRSIHLSDDSRSADDSKQKEEDRKEESPFVTEKKVYENKEDKNANLEDEMSSLEEKEYLEQTAQDKKKHEVGDVISPEENPNDLENKAASPTRFSLPVDGPIISKFGQMNMGKKNTGINIEAPLGTNVKAVSDGAVVFSGDDPRFGKLIIVKHNSGDLFSAYAHLEEASLKQNSLIKKGQIIGHVGKTGDVKKPQLYFAIRKGKTPVDPLLYIK